MLFSLERSVIQKGKFSWSAPQNPLPILFCLHTSTSLEVEGEKGSETKSVPCEPRINIVVKGLSGKKAEVKNIELSLSQFLVSL